MRTTTKVDPTIEQIPSRADGHRGFSDQVQSKTWFHAGAIVVNPSDSTLQQHEGLLCWATDENPWSLLAVGGPQPLLHILLLLQTPRHGIEHKEPMTVSETENQSLGASVQIAV